MWVRVQYDDGCIIVNCSCRRFLLVSGIVPTLARRRERICCSRWWPGWLRQMSRPYPILLLIDWCLRLSRRLDYRRTATTSRGLPGASDSLLPRRGSRHSPVFIGRRNRSMVHKAHSTRRARRLGVGRCRDGVRTPGELFIIINRMSLIRVIGSRLSHLRERVPIWVGGLSRVASSYSSVPDTATHHRCSRCAGDRRSRCSISRRFV